MKKAYISCLFENNLYIQGKAFIINHKKYTQDMLIIMNTLWVCVKIYENQKRTGEIL